MAETTPPGIWFWNGEYAEGMSAAEGWFCFEVDADPEHPELGGVTVTDAERVLGELGFTADEIAAERERCRVAQEAAAACTHPAENTTVTYDVDGEEHRYCHRCGAGEMVGNGKLD